MPRPDRTAAAAPLAAVAVACAAMLAADPRPTAASETPDPAPAAASHLCLQRQMPWGPVRAAATDGDLAVVGVGAVALVVHVTLAGEPRVLADVVLPAAVSSAAFLDRYAVLGDQDEGFHVVDLVVPSVPRVVAFLELPDEALALAVGDGFAVAAMDHAGLAVIDLGDPTEPDLVSVVHPTDWVLDVAVAGRRAFVAGSSYPHQEAGALAVVDLADPGAPATIAALPFDAAASAVALLEHHAVVTVVDAGLVVVDVADPAAPAPVASLDRPTLARDIAMHGSTACITSSGEGLVLVDLDDPLAPSVTATLGVGGWPTAIAVTGDHAMVAAGQDGLAVVDLSSATTPTVVARLDGFRPILDAVAEDDRVYAALSTAIRIFDESSLGEPAGLGELDLTGVSLVDFEVDGGLLYLVGQPAGSPLALLVYDVTAAGDPALVGRLDGIGAVSAGPLVLGEHVILAEYHDRQDGGYFVRLRVVRVAEPSAPVEVGSVDFDGFAFDIAAAGDFLYAIGRGADNEGGVQVVDISHLDGPIAAAWVPTSGWSPREIVISGRTAVVSDTHGLHLLDFSSPAAPVEVGSIWLGYSSLHTDLRISGDLALVRQPIGVHVVDVSNPAQPVQLEYRSLRMQHYGIDVEGRRLWLAAGASGLQAFGWCPSVPPRRALRRVGP